jgi:hypothetical protein
MLKVWILESLPFQRTKHYDPYIADTVCVSVCAYVCVRVRMYVCVCVCVSLVTIKRPLMWTVWRKTCLTRIRKEICRFSIP